MELVQYGIRIRPTTKKWLQLKRIDYNVQMHRLIDALIKTAEKHKDDFEYFLRSRW